MPDWICSATGLKHQLGHEFDGVAWRPVFTGFLVIFLVETTYEVLEDCAHGVVVQFGQFDRVVVVLDRVRAEVDVWREEPA